MKHNPLTHPRPKWLDRGILYTGMQEAFIFQKQRGGLAVDSEEKHFAWRCEEVVKRAKADGFNMIMLPGQKGAGLEAEREDIEASAKMARLCHKHGLRVGTYIGDTLLTTTAFREMPESRNWVTRNAFGQPTYYGTMVFRQVACRQNPGYIEFLKRVIRVCIEEIGADLLHFDNWVTRPEPHRCRCEHCVAGFKAFVRAKYDDEALKARYGFTDLSELGAPPIHEHPDLEDWKQETIVIPWLQDWIEYHAVALAEAYRKVAEYARSLKPDIAIECNPCGIDGRNTVLTRSVDHPRLLPHGDCVWTEEASYPGISPEGDLITRVRSFKMARTLRQVMFVYITPPPPHDPVLSVAEALAFNQQTLGTLKQLDGQVKRYIEFRRQHEDLYLGTELIADASVLRNFETLAFHNWEPHVAVRLAEQALLQGHVPFELIFDQQFTVEAPHVLVMPDVRCISDDMAELIRERVRNGMGLVATGRTACYTPWVRERPSPALADLLGFRSASDARWSVARRNTFGKGRVAYLPTLPPSRPLPKPADFYIVGTHQLPANWPEFVEAVRWAGEPSLELLAPKTVIAEFLTQPGRVLVHLINLDRHHPVAGIELRLAPKLRRGKSEACFLSPDTGSPQALPISRKEGAMVLPLLETYGVLVIS